MANTRCFNLDIPYPFLRLGECVVEDLVHAGIETDISEDATREALERHVELTKRASREMLRHIAPEDYRDLNHRLGDLRESISPDDHLKIRAYYSRGICQVLKVARR